MMCIQVSVRDSVMTRCNSKNTVHPPQTQRQFDTVLASLVGDIISWAVDVATYDVFIIKPQYLHMELFCF